MQFGKIYDPNEESLMKKRVNAHLLCQKYNAIPETSEEERKTILKELLGYDADIFLQGPIQFDYGINTHFGKGCYANFNLVILDVCPVTLGDYVFMGPNVSIVTPLHPLIPEERNPYFREDGVMTDREYGKPITIGSNCWIASNVTITGGVNIGEGCVIGAGSVVTKDIPAGYIAYGNPCKPIRKITKEDSIWLKKELWD